MMKLSRIFPLLALVTLPALADVPLRIVKSDTGYLFTAQSKAAKATGYEFDVPGKAIRTSEGNGRIFAVIDGVMVQLLRVPAAMTEDEALAAHRQTEVAYLEKNKAVIAESALCANLALPHAEWIAELKGVSSSRYLTVKIDDTILVLVVASNAKSPPGLAEQQLAGICSTFKR
ncbi:hypothetical protein LP420_25725 [Massilia sp. B-10]|nr:hypothetical protein LP420_25725 [Massilia sp. B-10]